MQISKSDYMLFLRQPAWLWLKKNDPSKLPPVDAATQAMFDAGHAFEPYVESLFPGGVALGFSDFDEYRSLPLRTQQAFESGAQVVFQPRFEWNGFTCISDIVSVVEGKTVDLYEIKSSTRVKPDHLYDLAFQKTVLEGGNELSRKRAPDEQWISLHGDLVGVYREGDNEIILVLVDARAREPISYTTESPETVIEDLREAGSFQVVHTALANIDEIIRYMSIEHAKELASIMLANNQIYGIAQDDDVAQLASELFELLDSNSETELAGEIKERYQLNLLTTRQVAELPF